MAPNFTDFAQISTISFPVLTTTPHAARRNFFVFAVRPKDNRRKVAFIQA